jgi:hypothetical protein
MIVILEIVLLGAIFLLLFALLLKYLNGSNTRNGDKQ